MTRTITAIAATLLLIGAVAERWRADRRHRRHATTQIAAAYALGYNARTGHTARSSNPTTP